MGAGYSEIIADSRYGVNTDFQEFRFDIPEVRMDAVNSDPCVSCKRSDTFFDGFSGALEVVVIEIEPDEYIPFVKFLDDSYGMASESEGAVDHDIPLCSAQIEAVYILVEEYWNMSETFFVQIVKK